MKVVVVLLQAEVDHSKKVSDVAVLSHNIPTARPGVNRVCLIFLRYHWMLKLVKIKMKDVCKHL